PRRGGRRETEKLSLREMQPGRQGVGPRGQTGESEPGARYALSSVAPETAAEHRRQRDVVEDVQPAKRARDLISPGQAEPRDAVRPNARDVLPAQANRAP